MQEEENNGFGPFFKQRGSRATWAAIFCLAAFVVATLVVESSEDNVLQFYLVAFGLSLLAWIVGEMTRRFCLFVEEAFHRRSRYEGSWTKALKTSFDHQNKRLIAILIAFAMSVAVYSLHQSNQDAWVSSIKVDFARLLWLNAIFVPIFGFLFGLGDLSRVEYSQMNEKENKNLADGLAWGYYFGYLKFVLPALDTQINLTEKYRYSIDVHKVFIIVPKNCQVFDHISNKHSDPKNLVKSLGNLEPLKKNRGGIQDRIYRHTVHSIKDENTGKNYHCVMEYATPLMNLFDMSNDRNAGLSREERDNQVNLFVAKLREILDNDPECKEKYKLVVYGGGDQDIGKIMISALKDSALEISDKQ